MNLKTIANFAFKNDDFKSYVNQFASDEQIDNFIKEAGKNSEFKDMQKSIFKNIFKNDGYMFAQDGEDRQDAALKFATETIGFFENDYANNLTDDYLNGKIDFRALGFVDGIFDEYEDILSSFDLDGDIESISAQEVASYILALDEQSKLDGIISLDDIQSIDFAKLQESANKHYEDYCV